MKQVDGHDAAFWPLLHAIASGDAATASRLLDAAPPLALMAAPMGATRASASPYFLEEIEHHVYAGDTALHIAAAAYREDIARALVAHAANPSASNRRGAAPLHYAADGHPGSVRWNPTAQATTIVFLIRAGADPNAADTNGATPLHRAVRTRCAAAVRTLIEHGGDVNARNKSGSTPLELAHHNTGRGGSGSLLAKAQQEAIITLLSTHGG